MAIDPVQGRAYVTARSDRQVAVVDTTTNTVVARIDIARFVDAVAIGPVHALGSFPRFWLGAVTLGKP